MRRVLIAVLSLCAVPAGAQTADEIVAKYIKAIGGMEKINAINSYRRTGKFTGGGGFEAKVVEEKKRPNDIRQEFSFQGMTGVTAYDGKNGWKIEPWQGKKDPEPLGEDELKSIVEDSDFEGPLVNYQAKGNKVEYVGTEPVEGTDAYKLRVTLKNGDVLHYYMDTDYFVPIKIDTKRFIRGEEREFETSLGDYKEVGGVYMPYSSETNAKGSPNKSKVTIEKVELNVPLAADRFVEPRAKGAAPSAAPDAANVQPKKPEEPKPAANEPKKPPRFVILSREGGEGSQVASVETLRSAQGDGGAR
jgi:outer membrane lipoprotein-sorting protein